MIRRQITRWLFVGLVTNCLLYLAYLALTRSLLEPKTAMTVVYVAGVIVGFVGHRSWSFEHSGRVDSALLRYLGSYGIGYLINLAGLGFGISMLGLRHELVQATMVVTVAVVMFLLQKYFVFREPRSATGASAGKGP